MVLAVVLAAWGVGAGRVGAEAAGAMPALDRSDWGEGDGHTNPVSAGEVALAVVLAT